MNAAKKQTVFFLGTPEFAVPSFQALVKNSAFDVQLVITQPDKPVGRKQIIAPSPVKVAAEEYGIPVFQPEKLNTAWSERPVQMQPDFLVVVAYGQLLNDEVLNAAAIAPVNVHASLLPRWRGASPLQHSILHGDSETGVTVQRMVKELDAGPILGRAAITMDSRETLQTLHDKLSLLGADLLIKTLSEPLHPQEQDTSLVTHCTKLKREDGDVDTQAMTAEEIDRKVRALVPWPGVRMELNGTTVKIWETALQENEHALPLSCKDNTILYLLTLQAEGKKPVRGDEWKRSH